MPAQGIREAMLSRAWAESGQPAPERAGLRTRSIGGKKYFLDAAGLYVPAEKYRRRGDTISCPEQAAEAFSSLKYETNENFAVLILDTRFRLLFFKKIVSGSATFCTVTPPDVFREVLIAGSIYFVIGHNHTSGDTNPSAQDKNLTKNFQQGAGILSLNLLDHVIVGGDSAFFSFRERGLLQ